MAAGVMRDYMTINKRYISSIILLIGTLLATSCGESAKEREAREAAEAEHKADSIAQIEAERAKLEQQRLDSIASVQKRTERIAADSALRAELLPVFAEEKNADGSGASLYKIKDAPKGHLQNYAYLSFTVDNGSAREIFINVCYNGKDWLNIERCSIEIDDDINDISIGDVSNKVNDNLSCSEWFTAPLYSGTIDKLMDTKTVKIRIIGDENSKSITLTPKQISGIQKTIKLYRAFGG